MLLLRRWRAPWSSSWRWTAGGPRSAWSCWAPAGPSEPSCASGPVPRCFSSFLDIYIYIHIYIDIYIYIYIYIFVGADPCFVFAGFCGFTPVFAGLEGKSQEHYMCLFVFFWLGGGGSPFSGFRGREVKRQTDAICRVPYFKTQDTDRTPSHSWDFWG